VTNPTTLTELREWLDDESRWIVHHIERVLDRFPKVTADKIRHDLVIKIFDHSMPNENAQKNVNFRIKTAEDVRKVLEGVSKDYADHGELDSNARQALHDLENNLPSHVRELKK
jgi:hypothetical protein